jgi:cation diffusion facilitator CzcD-associated flavoprotein CzcO
MRESVDVAIIGAGPYGLSLAAHLRSRGVEFRIFGEPMGSWKNNMPQGMLLKSYPWASNIAEPGTFTVKKYCAASNLPYDDTMEALPRETFISYGEAFQARFVPSVERKMIVSLEPAARGFHATFDDGTTVQARRVVVAVGTSAFQYVPPTACHLRDVISHSGDYGPLDGLAGKKVVVVGSGSSATDLSALLHERGNDVSLIARTASLNFAGTIRQRGSIERAMAPDSGIGEGWTLQVCASVPWMVHYLPEHIRIRLAHTRALGPLGGSFMRDRVIGKVPLLLGRKLVDVKSNGMVELRTVAADGTNDTIRADHVIFATGYKIDVGRLSFLGRLRKGMRLIHTAPRLSRHYQSSVPGLHFIGPASANSFGPVCRFVFGTPHPARHLARHFSGEIV